jgi:hypothetical protein
VTKIGELGTTQAATSNRRTLRTSSETSVLTRATRRNNPEETILHSHRRENLKSYEGLLFREEEAIFMAHRYSFLILTAIGTTVGTLVRRMTSGTVRRLRVIILVDI